MTKVSMSDLPAFLEEAVSIYGLNQDNAYSIHINRGNKDCEKRHAAKRMCGACFGGHLADFFKTPLREVGTGTLLELVDNDEKRTLCQHLQTVTKTSTGVSYGGPIKSRYYMDGVASLFSKLYRQPDFVDWYYDSSHWNTKKAAVGHLKTLNNNRRVNWSNIIDIVAEYLYKKCGAPKHCFAGDKWPTTTRPHVVAARMLELNRGM